jgi:hypothetical protein
MRFKIIAIAALLIIESSNGFAWMAHKERVYDVEIPSDCKDIISANNDGILCRDEFNNYFEIYRDSWIYRRNYVRGERTQID